MKKRISRLKKRNLYLQLVISYVAFLLCVFFLVTAVFAGLLKYDDYMFQTVDEENLSYEQMVEIQEKESRIFSISMFGTLASIGVLTVLFSVYMGKKIKRQEKEVEAARQKMLADISHDLRTPITVIQGYSKAIADDVVPEENVKKYLNTIYQKSNRLSELIGAFYDYSRLEHPEFQISPKEGDLTEYLRGYVAGKYEEFELAGYELDVDIPESPIVASFDHMELSRVFENIISNSVKHNQPPMTIYVSLERLKEKHQVRIRIGDDGDGIPEELKEHLFEPFVVGDEARSSKHGTGLGLSVAKRITEAHGGNIRLLSSEETSRSTMYEILLPIK